MGVDEVMRPAADAASERIRLERESIKRQTIVSRGSPAKARRPGRIDPADH